jgi:hypothetical protein
MLQRLNGQISECLAHAADARSHAAQATDRRTKEDCLSLARSWNCLAESYQFAESLDRFLYGTPEAADGWQPASSAPADRWLELAVIDQKTTHQLVFPCCRTADGWVEARTHRRIEVAPTHWREWVEVASPDRQPQSEDHAAEDASDDNGLVIFENEQARLQVARGDNGLFELVVGVRGEEVTAYDLDGDRLATIGRRLLTLAGKG